MIVKPADISRELSVILMYLISLIARPSLSVIFRVYVPGAWWCTSAVGCGNIIADKTEHNREVIIFLYHVQGRALLWQLEQEDMHNTTKKCKYLF